MISNFFHRWEHQLHNVSKTRRVTRPFEWGLEWVPPNRHGAGDPPEHVVREWIDSVMANTDAFFTPPVTSAYTFTPAVPGASTGGEAGTLTFPSALTTPHPENNTVY